MQSITTFEKFKKIDSKVQEDLSNNGVSIEKNITGLVYDDTTRSINFYKDLTPIEHSDAIGTIQAKKNNYSTVEYQESGNYGIYDGWILKNGATYNDISMCNHVQIFSSFEILQHETLVELEHLKTEKRKSVPMFLWEYQSDFANYTKYSGWDPLPTGSIVFEPSEIHFSADFGDVTKDTGDDIVILDKVRNADFWIKAIISSKTTVYRYRRAIQNSDDFIFLDSNFNEITEEVAKIKQIKFIVNSSDIDVIFMEDGYEDIYVPKIRYDFMKDDIVLGEYYLYPQVGTIPFGISGWDKYNGVYDHAVIDSSKVDGNNYIIGVNKVSTTPNDTSITIQLSNEWSALDTPVSSFTIPEIPKSTEVTEENIRALFNK